MSLKGGVIPASMTPFDAEGRVDGVSLLRLLSGFVAAGCSGVVLAGTNGEGASLGAVEKRDLVRMAAGFGLPLPIILGIATPSLDEAVWLLKQAGKSGASGALLLPPGYVRRAAPEGITAWLRVCLDASPVPVLLYHNPGVNGVGLSPEIVEPLAEHPRFAGIKDSSPQIEHWPQWRKLARPDSLLLVGDERNLLRSLEAGGSGTISGCANLLAQWLVAVVREEGEARQAKFELVLPAIEALRGQLQPETTKACLAALGRIDRAEPRLPLLPGNAEPVLTELRRMLGIQ